MKTRGWKLWILTSVWAVACCVTAANAEDAVQLGEIEVAAGQRHVVVPLSVANEQPLTLLNLRVSFDPALCAMIETEGLRRAGRATVDPLAGGGGCPAEGVLAIALLDLMGEAVIPPGEGPVVEWTFDVREDADGGIFPLAVSVKQASNGPTYLSMRAEDGNLVITRSADVATALCPGDCDGDGTVSVSELMVAVNIALGSAQPGQCPNSAQTADGAPAVSDLVGAVQSALSGCSPN